MENETKNTFEYMTTLSKEHSKPDAKTKPKYTGEDYIDGFDDGVKVSKEECHTKKKNKKMNKAMLDVMREKIEDMEMMNEWLKGYVQSKSEELSALEYLESKGLPLHPYLVNRMA